MADGHKLLLNKISGRLHEIFDGHINLRDLGIKDEAHLEGYFLTRALAALALLDEADLQPDEAAACITDGGADDGIDAIYFDEKNKIIYFVQSKWRTGSGGIHLSEFTRFRDGVMVPENANLHRFRGIIESALSNIDTSVVMLFVHTCENAIAVNINKKITEFLREQNKYISDFLGFKEIDLSSVTHIARSKTRTANIDLTIMLRQWGRITEPYPAVYGVISALDIAGWHEQYGHKLFVERALRNREIRRQFRDHGNHGN